MDHERYKRLSDLFSEACELPPAKRYEFLERECAGDPQLREELEALLARDASASEVLGDKAGIPDLRAGSLDLGSHPERIGPYRIENVLGEGGMGIVYLAEQEQPVRRQVAIKLVKLGMDTKQVIARFESEGQALALMKHQNVARVYDAGATEVGRPYFAMEYVGGIRITEHCDKHQLSTPERLKLFMQVCEGVQHAHQKGIIHRDIKPSNVLVETQDTTAVPKIIDFGIAKATEQRLTEHTLATELGQLVGTPEYMSPEQAEGTGTDLDTRTDVYSLGVLLYELLVGSTPFASRGLRAASIEEIRRTIREDEPSRPSTQIALASDASTEAASKRRTDPPTLRKQLKGDLDWITMRALEKDRARRYASVSDLIADIQRHLNHEPVVASPPSRLYRCRKFVRRHTIGVSVASAFLLLVLASSVVVALQARRIAGERDRANMEAESARQVADYLVGLFEVSDPGEARGSTVTAREVLDKGAESVQELTDQPLVQARFMSTIGRVYQNLGLYDQARPLLDRALEVRRTQLGERHREVARSLDELAALLLRTGDYEDAQRILERALDILERLPGAAPMDIARTLSDLGDVYWYLGEYDAARPFYERALAVRTEELGPEHSDVAANIADLADLLFVTGSYEEARPLYEQALEINEKAHGADHPHIAVLLNNLGSLLYEMHDFEEARTVLTRAMAIDEKALGPDHPELAGPLNNLGRVLVESGDYRGARSLFERALSISKRALGSDHADLAMSLDNLGYLDRRLGNFERSQSFYERALVLWEDNLGADHPDVAMSLQNLADVLVELGGYEEARPLYDRALIIREEKLGPNHPEVAETLQAYSRLLRRLGDEPAARAADIRARAILDIR